MTLRHACCSVEALAIAYSVAHIDEAHSMYADQRLVCAADEFWQQQFGMLSEVTWNQFWKQFEGSFVPYLPMEKPLPQELLKQNISSASSKVITSKDFLQAAGSQPLHSFFTQCMNGDIQWSRTVGGQGHAWTDRVVASQGELQAHAFMTA